jgi:hypothetical protein
MYGEEERYPSIDVKIILKWIFKKWNWGAWTGSIWTRGRLL